ARWCHSSMRAPRSSPPRCSPARRVARSRSTRCSIARPMPAASTAFVWRVSGCMSARPRPLRLRRLQSWPAQPDGMASRGRVFTIPASVPFLPALVRAILDGRLIHGVTGGDPLSLVDLTLYLPTRRACRLAREVFLDEIGTEAAVLPRIVAIGDIDEDELAFADAATGAVAEQALELPPALSGAERRFLLARLGRPWGGAPELRGSHGAPLIADSPAAALALADDLAHLIDDMTTRQVAWDRLDDLVPERFDVYWQLSLTFLTIAREAWPKILVERGAIE